MVTSDLKRNNIVHMPKKQATTRIIGGSLRGSKLPFKENRSIRPTE